jgi:branched-subunit amino acid aminotransferase/4-amino-4-deoxychorismate lyase
MTEPLAFLNGNVVPQSQACLALNDAGFIFGATVTDLCRTFRHRLFRWTDHLARFRRSCQAAAIHAPFTDEQITATARDLVARNAELIAADADLALVLFATPGPVGFYLGQHGKAGEAPTFGMHTFPLPFQRYRPWIENGVHLTTPAVRQLPNACVNPHIKHRSRLHWWLAEQEARRSGAQALLLDLDGHVTETASANFLIVKDGAILSPPRAAVLEGISLKVVTELCGRLHIPFVERNLTLDDCYTADEALLTCTTFCLAGVGQINNRVIPALGPMLRRLHDAWSADVGIDIHRQILEKKDA